MNKRILTIAAILLQASFLPITAWAGDNDDFGMDYSIGAEKKLTSNLDFGLNLNYRTQDNSKETERWVIGGGFSYKLLNTKTFDIKLNADWEYMRQFKLKELVYKYGDILDEDGNWTTGVNGWNSTASYWRSRHRTSLGFSGNYKPNKRWSFSLKETVQYNHYCETDSIDAIKYRVKYNDDDEEYKTQDVYKKTKRAKDKFVLRSKITGQYDIRHCPLAPFVSLDYGCGLNYSASKWKITAGTDIKITKQHKLDVFYRFQTENDDDEPNGHIIGVGYKFKF
ncbi:MAG: DUF2490 domain-containing protein [Bacteroidaceae bacterium]|nr:DUF2490 domain-containing protein [Bacteroidaceae bacterium]